MKKVAVLRLLASALLCGSMAVFAAGCGGGSAQGGADAGEAASQEAQAVADGTYQIEAETDSSMFRSESCTLTVEGDTLTAELVLPGEGFSRLYFGTAEDAAQASDDDIYDYRLDDEGRYTFDIPVSALDEELAIAAYGQRRDTWYDHTITFHAPAEDGAADAA